MALRVSTLAVLLIILPAPLLMLHAQPAKAPGMNEIMTQLDAHLKRYDGGVPSLFCDEHIVSSQTQRNLPGQNIVTDSIFRLKRTARRDHTTSLEESREVKTVDGKPATVQDNVDGPALLSGLFEGGLAVVSVGQARCMSYKLQPVDRKHPSAPYIVHFATVLTPENSADCFLQEASTGRAVIDPLTMQVTHLDILTKHHVIDSGSSFMPTVTGRRELSVDYAPVMLGGENFWMPSVVNMRTSSGIGYDKTIWSFQADYRNYRRMEVTVHLFPGSEASAP